MSDAESDHDVYQSIFGMATHFPPRVPKCVPAETDVDQPNVA